MEQTQSNIQLFNNPEFGEVRGFVDENGNPWLVGKDVAEVLGYSNPRKALIDHVDNEDKTDGVTIRDSIGREQHPICINESGFFSLVISSKLPKAKQFRRWVTSEVLPSIRKTGGYSLPQPQEDPDLLIAKALVLAQNKIAAQEATIAAQAQTINRQDRQMAQKENYIGIVEKAADELNEKNAELKEEVSQLKKENLDHERKIPINDMRSEINEIIKKTGDFERSWNTLYRRYELLQRVNLTARIQNYEGGRLDYIEKELHDIETLYDLCIKLNREAYDKIQEDIRAMNRENPVRKVCRRYSRKK